MAAIRHLSRSELQRLRLSGQRLASRTPIAPLELVERLGAIQAQDKASALLGLICLGPEQSGEETYVLLDEWIKQPAMEIAGWKRLARRYLAAYGPATVDDFARWSGARKREAWAAFAACNLVKLHAQNESLWLPVERAGREMREASSAAPPLRLLPAYDPVLLGYRSRDWLVESAFARKIHPGGGFLRPTLVAEGEATGTWKTYRRGDRLAVVVAPFATLSDNQVRALEDEVDELGRFYGLEATWAIEGGESERL